MSDRLAVSATAMQVGSLGDAMRLAGELAKARGFVPRAYEGQPASCLAVILTGLELGMGPMEAMRSIHIIEGRPTMSAELMLARAHRAGVRYRWIRTDAERAEIEMVTEHGAPPQRMTWTIDDARAAGLTGRGPWKAYPAAMLRARCASAAIRAFAPWSVGPGIYTPEEIAPASMSIAESGEPAEVVVERSEQRERRDEAPALSEGLSESELAVCAMLRDQIPTMAAGELRDAWTSLSRGQRAEVARTMDPRHKRALWDAITSEQRDELRGMK